MAYQFLEKTVLGNPLDDVQYKIIGGGIAGLFLGYYMKKRGWPFRIIEKSERVGGLIGTEKNEYGYSEKAANGFIRSEELQNMADELGIELLAPAKSSKAKYIVEKKRLKKIPLSVAEIINAFYHFVRPHQKHPQTVREFADIYFGKAVAEKVINPALGGIYAADIEDLSFPGTMPTLAKLQEQGDFFWLNLFKGSGKKGEGVKGTYSFKHGLGELTSALQEYLHEEIKLHADGMKFIKSQKPMVLCVPAYKAAAFFEGHELAEMLRNIRYIPLISIKIFFRKEDVEKMKHGFGCVVPRTEGLHTIGILFNHDIFPSHIFHADTYSLTCIMRENYKSTSPRLLNLSDKDLKHILLKELNQIFKINGEPLHVQVDRYDRGIPLYSPEHYENLFKIDRILKKDFPNIRIFGNYTGQISIRGMATEAAKTILSHND